MVSRSWFSLNILKCKPIIIGTSRLLSNINTNDIHPVTINGQVLKYESTVVNLGVRIMSNLSWSNQVNYVCNRIYQCIYQFRRLCFNPPYYVKKVLVETLVFPIFDYAISVYCDCNEELTNKLQVAQNACIRYIFNLRLDEHVTRYYVELCWLKIKERRELSILTTTYKVLKDSKPEYLYEMYARMQTIHLRETRFGNELIQFPIHRTVIYTKSFHVLSIRLMNSLDNEIKNLGNVKSFS